MSKKQSSNNPRSRSGKVVRNIKRQARRKFSSEEKIRIVLAGLRVILTDQAYLREENCVMKPGAYFNTMVNRAKTGDLKLHKFVMGMIRRANDDALNDDLDQKAERQS